MTEKQKGRLRLLPPPLSKLHSKHPLFSIASGQTLCLLDTPFPFHTVSPTPHPSSCVP